MSKNSKKYLNSRLAKYGSKDTFPTSVNFKQISFNIIQPQCSASRQQLIIINIFIIVIIILSMRHSHG